MPTAARSRRSALSAGLAAGLTLALVSALWLLFAPNTLGGDFSYAIVTGNSMEPRFSTDDVVLLRRADDYAVGDVVAYRHPQLGVVLHRIVEDDGERFSLKGDNRDGYDTYRPTRGDVVGREWVIVAGAGGVLREIQRPRNAILLAVAAVALALPAAAMAKRRRRRVVAAGPSITGAGASLSLFAPASKNIVAVLTVTALVSVALFALPRVRGATETATERIPFTEHGTFSYGRTVEGGVYDYDRLEAPEPLFRQLIDELPFQYQYELIPSAPGAELSDVVGSYRLRAELSQANGWKRTFEIQPTMLFGGGQFNTSVTIDLGEVDRQIELIEQSTGIISKLYTLRVIADVTAQGRLDGLPFTRELQQTLEFRLTALQLQFDPGTSELEVTTTASVGRPIEVGREITVPMLGYKIAYATMPRFSVAGFGLVALGSLAIALATLATWRSGEAARIRAAHGRLMVEIDQEEIDLAGRPMGVNQIDDLVRIAQWTGLPIMHREGEQFDEYFILARDAAYLYTSWKRPRGQTAGRSGFLGMPRDGDAERALDEAA